MSFTNREGPEGTAGALRASNPGLSPSVAPHAHHPDDVPHWHPHRHGPDGLPVDADDVPDTEELLGPGGTQ